MTADQILLANAVRTAFILVLAGLIVRRRVHLCWSLAAYVTAMLVGNALVSFWPDRFYVWWFYILKESIYNVLRLCVAAELAFRVFRGFPGALARARLVLAPLLAIVTLSILKLSWSKAMVSDYTTTELRVQTGGIWLLTATSLLIAWFNLPIHRLHRAVLIGLTSYQLIFASLVNVLRSFGYEEYRRVVSSVDGAALLLLLSWWAWTAWRPDAGYVFLRRPARVLTSAPEPSRA
jgi:hypothetical protein